jgi:PAS domain-containing protein
MATISHKSSAAADFAATLARAASLGGKPAFVVNADGIISAAANASGKIFGYDAADIVGRRFAGILTGGETQVAELWARARAKGNVARP